MKMMMVAFFELSIRCFVCNFQLNYLVLDSLIRSSVFIVTISVWIISSSSSICWIKSLAAAIPISKALSLTVVRWGSMILEIG